MTRQEIKTAKRLKRDGHKVAWIANQFGVDARTIRSVVAKPLPPKPKESGDLYAAFVSECKRAWKIGRDTFEREKLRLVIEANFPFKGWPQEVQEMMEQ